MAAPPIEQGRFVGQALGHYRIAQQIGAGGMGEVYRAHDEHLDREVAIKVLLPGILSDESSRKRFHKEALVLSRLNHPNIATIYDFDTQANVDFLVMEYIPGITLSEKLDDRPLAEKEVIRLGTQLAEGLSAAHEHGVVHRDLKPGNLRLTPDGRLKILDFGLAKLRLLVTTMSTETLTETQALQGTLPYMAPEQVLGEEIDARTDIHAVGLVLYEMATGKRPFAEVEQSQLIGAIVRSTPPPASAINPRVSPELERIIGKCLEKELENRYQSAKEIVVDLRRLSTPTAGAPVHAIQPKRRKAIAKAVMIGVVAVVFVVSSLSVLNFGSWRDRLSGHVGEAQIKSLAVLPLANLSHDPEQDYFADGMTEALITGLAKITELRVISRTSVMHYKGVQRLLPEIARELNVDAVVEGSVQRSGNRVKITAQLIRAATDQHLWAESYERDLRDVLGLQDEVASTIAQRVESKLRPSNQVPSERRGSVKPEAYEAYLKGLYYINKRTPESLRKSEEYFQQAIAKDPGYAPAYASLADFYNLANNYTILTPNESLPKARAAAMKALEIDSSLAEAHTALAIALVNDYDWNDAGNEFRRALELNPGSAQGHYWYSLVFLTSLGRHREAISEMQRARQLDPLSLITNANLGTILFNARQYDQAIQQCLRTLEMDPHFATAHYNLALAYEQKGMFEDAIREMQEAIADYGDGGMDLLAHLARAYALAGKRAEARQTITRLNRLSKQIHDSSSYERATVYLAVGQKDLALAQLQRAYEERSGQLIWLGTDPNLDGLRSDPRFRALLRRMNLAE